MLKTTCRIPLILILSIVYTATSGMRPQADRNPKVVNWPAGYFSPFKLTANPPDGFKDFDYFRVAYLPGQEEHESLLLPDSAGYIPTTGELSIKGGAVFRFKRSNLLEGRAEVRLEFATEEVESISYSFKGQYIKEGKRTVAEGGIQYIGLEGILTKYKNGLKVSEALVGLYRDVEE